MNSVVRAERPQVPAAAPAVIDVEASGFGRGSYPIEVGFVLPNGVGWCSLIRPEPDWSHWAPDAQAVHQITRPMLERHGRPVVEVARELNGQLRGLTVYSDAWAHDYPWLARLHDAADTAPSYRLQDLRLLLSEAELARWDRVRQLEQARSGLQRHRASADARILQQTVVALRSQAVVEGGGA